MKLTEWLAKFELRNIKFSVPYVEAEIVFNDTDREAAWNLYVEMLTRIVTQPLPNEHGDEKTALDSVYALFAITRKILKRKGRKCLQFSKIAVVVLNQVVRPFTAKWHKMVLANALNDECERQKFRKELAALQVVLRNYTKALADIADVEDLTAAVFQDVPSE